MKHLKIFENFNSEIEQICKEYNIRNYTINNDSSIDVDDDVDLSNKKITKIPLKFNHISGNFDCSYNKLTSLEGAPQSIGGNFNCSDNPVHSVWRLILPDTNKWDYAMMDLLKDCDIFRDNKTIVLDRLNGFLEDIGRPTVNKVRGYKLI